MKRADIIGGLVGMAIGLLALWQGSTMPTDVVMKIGPSFFPGLLAGGLILFSVTLLINALLGRSKGTVEALRLADPGTRRGLVTLGAAMVFCIIIEPLGFILSSILFLVFMIRMLGKRTPASLLAAPLLITIGVWVVFEKILHLTLPAGILAGIL
ncbi:MAG: tripartite tricarboxylate transporter TctB family protein [Candidatus Accumulibacter sp.]|nr:tripartite tricarboxylate transporter TctB family protein [Accumulibacter sp.]